MVEEMFIVAILQTGEDGDGAPCYKMGINIMPETAALEKFAANSIKGTVVHYGSKIICQIHGETGEWKNCGFYGKAYMLVCPVSNGTGIDGGSFWRLCDEVYGIQDWVEDDIADYENEKENEMKVEVFEDVEEVRFARESEFETACHRWDTNIKAKEHLAAIYPISTDSVRKNRNGAYIHKGNTNRWHKAWKRLDTKISREEGKREIREWEAETETITVTETVLTPSPEEMQIAIIRDYIREAEEEKAILERRIANMNRRIEELQEIISGNARSWSF